MNFENDFSIEKAKRRISRWYVFAGAATTAFLGWGTLNMSGFCFSEMRYVPDQEFFERFVESNEFFLKPDLFQIRNMAKDADVLTVSTYQNGKEFLVQNPGCCAFGPQAGVLPDSDLRVPNSIEKFLGLGWGTVAVHYVVNYTTTLGTKKQFKFFPQYWVNSCGQRVRPNY